MKTTIQRINSNSKSFPKLMIYEATETIILASGIKKCAVGNNDRIIGTVVHSVDDRNKLGDTCDLFVLDFVDFEGSLTLSND